MFLEAEPGAGVTPGNLGPDGAWPAPVRAAQGAGIWFPPNPVSQGWWQLGLGHIFKGGTTTRMSCRTRKALELAPRRKSSLSLRRPSRTSSEPADPTGGVPSRRRKVSERSRGPASSRGTARLRGAGRGPYSPRPHRLAGGGAAQNQQSQRRADARGLDSVCFLDSPPGAPGPPLGPGGLTPLPGRSLSRTRAERVPGGPPHPAVPRAAGGPWEPGTPPGGSGGGVALRACPRGRIGEPASALPAFRTGPRGCRADR